jgi:hypothetical protein
MTIQSLVELRSPNRGAALCQPHLFRPPARYGGNPSRPGGGVQRLCVRCCRSARMIRRADVGATINCPPTCGRDVPSNRYTGDIDTIRTGLTSHVDLSTLLASIGSQTVDGQRYRTETQLRSLSRPGDTMLFQTTQVTVSCVTSFVGGWHAFLAHSVGKLGWIQEKKRSKLDQRSPRRGFMAFFHKPWHVSLIFLACPK